MKTEQGTNNSFDNVKENFRGKILFFYYILWIQLHFEVGDFTMYEYFKLNPLLFYWGKIAPTFVKMLLVVFLLLLLFGWEVLPVWFFYWQKLIKHSSSQLI